MATNSATPDPVAQPVATATPEPAVAPPHQWQHPQLPKLQPKRIE